MTRNAREIATEIIGALPAEANLTEIIGSLSTLVGVETPPERKTEKEGYFNAYEGYSRTLRSWLVAYGIGAPVLFVSKDAAWAKVSESGIGAEVARNFLFGVALQVLLATVNKASLWAVYYGECRAIFKTYLRYKLAHWFSEQLWIDLLVDAASIGMFAWATYRILGILSG